MESTYLYVTITSNKLLKLFRSLLKIELVTTLICIRLQSAVEGGVLEEGERCLSQCFGSGGGEDACLAVYYGFIKAVHIVHHAWGVHGCGFDDHEAKAFLHTGACKNGGTFEEFEFLGFVYKAKEGDVFVGSILLFELLFILITTSHEPKAEVGNVLFSDSICLEQVGYTLHLGNTADKDDGGDGIFFRLAGEGSHGHGFGDDGNRFIGYLHCFEVTLGGVGDGDERGVSVGFEK